MFMTVLLTLGIVALVMLIMAAGVLLSGRCLRGSCGGPEVLDSKGESLTCGVCGRTRKADEPDPHAPPEK